MKLGVASLVLGLFLLSVGVFLVGGGAINQASYVGGWVMSTFGFVRLVWAGWRGRGSAWLIASLVAIPLAWTLYELVRQTVLPDIGVFGTMTAPTLSLAVATAIAIAGSLRLRAARA